MEGLWIPLPVQTATSTPSIFVQCSLTSDSYTVTATDLLRAWSESLSKEEINSRALTENTSINPNEDDSQFALILENITSPLRGEEGVVEIGSSAGNYLLLRTTYKLPLPLHSLVWTFRLRPSSESVIRRDIIAPLWLQSYQKEQQANYLIKLLKDKDHVIAKLLDQLETLNADMSTLFPSTTGLKAPRGQARRDQAARLVPGLGTFNEWEWRKSIPKQYPDVAMSSQPVISFTADNAIRLERIAREPGTIVSSMWWEKLEALPLEPIIPESCESQISRVVESQPPRKPAPATQEDSETEDEDSSEFQKQDTPPNQRKFEHEKISKEPISPAPRPRAISEISGTNDKESPARRNLGRIGGAANRGSVSESTQYNSDRAPAASAADGQNQKKPVRKLGRIGGPKRDISSHATTKPQDHGAVVQARTHWQPSLGTTAPQSAAPVASLEKANPEKGQNTAPPDRMAEEDINALADKKREELKRRLQQQAPSKKKRRF